MMRLVFKMLGAVDVSGVIGLKVILYCLEQRGYYAVGGEVFLIFGLAWAGWVLGDFLADICGLKGGKKHDKRQRKAKKI